MNLKRSIPLLLVTVFQTENQWAAETTNAPPGASTNAPSKFIDPKDGWFDMSSFLDTAYGFVPVVVPVTEPAIGYGAGAGLMFIDRNETQPGERPAPPNMGALAGLYTENGTWGILGGYSAWWLGSSLQTKVGGGYASVNLSYHGLGASSYNNHPVSYNLKPLGGLVEARYRLGKSPWLMGMGYAFAETKVSFQDGTLPPGVNLPSLTSRVGGFRPVVAFDTRDNIFTPTKGIYGEVTVALNDPAFGGDSDFQTVEPVFIYYLPLAPKWTLGVNATAGFSFGDAPFYSRPSITLRGAPAEEYQAEDIAQVEGELRWQFWKRFSLVGFGGGGVVWNNFDHFQNKRDLTTGGAGLRYELARKYGLHMGVDVAVGPDGPALYIQVGSAWFCP